MKKTNKFEIKDPSASKISIYAAAIQDHYFGKKGFNLQVDPISKPKKKWTGTRLISIEQNMDPQIKEKIPRPIHLNGINENKSKKQNILDEIKIKITKGNQEDDKKTQNKLKEYMNKLTLAQRLGIVEKPPKPLTVDEWKDIEEKGKTRSTDQNQCPICLEEFKTANSQVILSCTHVFHKTCLSNFEKFTKQKACPICRRQDYEKKNFDHGFVQYINRCSVKIQKIYRGYICRKTLYQKINQTYKATSLLFKRRLLAYKLRCLGEKMEKREKIKQKQTNELMARIDQNVETNQKLLNKLSELESANHRVTINNPQAVFGDDYQFIPKSVLGIEIDAKHSEYWKAIYEKAQERSEIECAICFNKLKNKEKKLTLLNCSHVFHENCLNAFEYYNVSHTHSCPVCRSHYERIVIKEWA
jgi:hypothetical protein